jgi:DNA polymerase III alpha subunit
LVEIIKHLREFKNEKSKVIIKDSRYETIKKKYLPYLEIYTKNSQSESFANWYYEKMLLGYTYNKDLKDIFADKRSDLMSVRTVNALAARSQAVFVGQVDDQWRGRSKNGNSYLKAIVSDESGTTPVMIFSKKMEDCESMNGSLPQKKNIVIVKGSKADGVVFADLIAVQDNKVYTRLSELKN